MAPTGVLERLDRVRTPEPLGKVLDERTAYLIAGSFDGTPYEAVYGKALHALEREWRTAP